MMLRPRAVYAARGLRAGWRLVTDADFRTILWLRLTHARDLHQTTTATAMDRYPAIFTRCRDYFGGRSDLNLLSFGCATGEEVLTLRAYFPTARITGADINPRNLAVCRRLPVDAGVNFIESTAAGIRDRGPFDAIFCMAVLQRTPQRIRRHRVESLRSIYPFEKFDRQVTELDACLKAGGLLVLHAAQYLFEDASVAPRYRPADPHPPNPAAWRFGRDSLHAAGRAPTASIFVKTA